MSKYKKLKKQVKVPTAKELKKIENMKKLKKILAIVIPAIIVLVIATVITVATLNDYGIIIRNTTVIKTDTFNIDGAMMTYFYWDTVNDALEGENAGSYKVQGFASVDDLDSVSFTGQSWREYFAEMSVQAMQSMLSFAHYAVDEGKVLNDEDNAEIEKELIRIEGLASIYGIPLEKYLGAYYGRGVNMEDIRKTLEIVYLSSYGMDLLNENVTVSDEEIESYYSNDQEKLECVDYLFFVTGISGKNNLNEEQQEFYSTRAGYISQATTEEEFTKRVTDFIKEENDKRSDDDEEKLNAEELEEYIDSEIKNMRYEKSIFDPNNSSLDNWIFSKDRKAGDSFINHTEGYGTYGIVYILKPNYIPDDWKDTAKSNILTSKKRAILDDIDAEYKITVKIPNFVGADIN